MNKRRFSLVVPPVLALAGAVLYTQYRLGQATDDVAAFCASVATGLPARAFIERALAADLDVSDSGPDADTVTASRSVYGWRKEVFECRAARDGAGLVRRAETAYRTE